MAKDEWGGIEVDEFGGVILDDEAAAPDPRQVALEGMLVSHEMLGPKSPLGATAAFTASDEEISKQREAIAMLGAQQHELITGPTSPLGATAAFGETPEQRRQRLAFEQRERVGGARAREVVDIARPYVFQVSDADQLLDRLTREQARTGAVFKPGDVFGAADESGRIEFFEAQPEGFEGRVGLRPIDQGRFVERVGSNTPIPSRFDRSPMREPAFDQSVLSAMGNAFAGSAMDVLGQAVQGTGTLDRAIFGEQTTGAQRQQAGQEFRDAAAEQYRVEEQNRDNMAVGLAGAAGSSLPFMAAGSAGQLGGRILGASGVISRGPMLGAGRAVLSRQIAPEVANLMGPASSALVGGAASAQGEYEQAIERGASPEQAERAAMLGLMSGATEALGIGRGALGRSGRLLAGGAEEAGQEMFQSVTSTFNRLSQVGPDTPLGERQQIADAAEQAAMGFLLGGAIEAPAAIANALTQADSTVTPRNQTEARAAQSLGIPTTAPSDKSGAVADQDVEFIDTDGQIYRAKLKGSGMFRTQNGDERLAILEDENGREVTVDIERIRPAQTDGVPPADFRPFEPEEQRASSEYLRIEKLITAEEDRLRKEAGPEGFPDFDSPRLKELYALRDDAASAAKQVSGRVVDTTKTPVKTVEQRIAELQKASNRLAQRRKFSNDPEERSAIFQEWQPIEQELAALEAQKAQQQTIPNEIASDLKPKRGGETGAVPIPGRRETSFTPGAFTVPPWQQRLRRFWMGPSGAFPKAVRKIIRQGQFDTRAIVSKGESYGGDLRRDIERVAKGSVARDALLQQVDRVLLGDAPLSSISDPDLRDSTRSAREYLDSLSELSIKNGIVTGEMADTFRSNMGKWLKRYYAAFDPEANWNYDALLNRAYREPLRRANVKDAKIANIVQDAEALIRKQNPGITGPELEAVMRALVDRSMLESAMTGGNLGTDRVAKALGSLIRRKDIPVQIRRYMGEETNPLLRFSRSVDFMGQLIARSQLQQDMRNFLLANGLASTKQEGRHSIELYPDEKTFVQKFDEAGNQVTDPEGNPLGEYRTRTEKRMGAFRGLWGSPELKLALDQFDPSAFGMEAASSGLGKFMGWMASEAKMAKVPLSPQSWTTNALGGLFMAMQSGTVNVLNPKKTVRLFRESMQTMRAPLPKTAKERSSRVVQELRDMHQRLVKSGVLDSAVALRDMEASIGSYLGAVTEGKVLDSFMGAARVGYYGGALGEAVAGPPGAVAGAAMGAATGAIVGGKRATKALQKFSQYAIGSPDNYFKTMVFLDNFETYAKANPGMTPDQVAAIAADITMDTMPTYSRIPAGLRTISRYGLINSFFQFNYEMLRNTVNSYWYATKEVASGNPVLMRRGMRRMIGASAMLTMASPYAAQALSGILTGTDDDDFRAALHRFFLPAWDRNSPILITGRDGTKITYVNFKYILPQSLIGMGIEAVRQGRTTEESIKNAWEAYMDEFLVQGVHVAPVIDAFFRNRKGFRSLFDDTEGGSPVTNKRGVEGFVEKFGYAFQKVAEPGFITQTERMRKALTGEMAEYGKTYTVEDQLSRLLGLRENTYDLSKSLGFRWNDLNKRWAAVRAQEKRIENLALSPEKLAEERDWVRREKAFLVNESRDLRRAARDAEIPRRDIEKAQKGIARALRPWER